MAALTTWLLILFYLISVGLFDELPFSNGELGVVGVDNGRGGTAQTDESDALGLEHQTLNFVTRFGRLCTKSGHSTLVLAASSTARSQATASVG